MMLARAMVAGLLTSLALAGHVAADVVHLHDGRRVAGQVVDQPSSTIVVVETAGGRLTFRATEVARIERSGSEEPALPATQPESGSPSPGPITVGGVQLDPAEREQFSRAVAEADRALTADEGLAVWTRFLQANPAGVLAELARQRLPAWQERVTRGLVRFGPSWIPREEADRKNAQADELLVKAAKIDNLDEACRVLDEAAGVHPYRVDTPFTKGRRLVKSGRNAEAAGAFLQALTANPDHAASLNNAGVLLAFQKKWERALGYLLRAAQADSDTIFDNLDQVMASARERDCPRPVLLAAERQLRQIVDDLHKAGKRVGRNRWGNSWIDQTQFDLYSRENQKLAAQYAANQAKLNSLEEQRAQAARNAEYYENELRRRWRRWDSGDAYRDLRDGQAAAREQVGATQAEMDKLNKDNEALLAKRRVIPHANRLVLLETDARSEMHSFSLVSEEANRSPRD